METLEPILTKHPFFAGLDKPYLQLITGCASNARFETGAYLFREGQEATQFYILRQGKVAIQIRIPGQGAKTLYTHDAGDVVGWSWLFSPYHWVFDCCALEATRVIALDGVCLRNKCEQDHVLGYEFMKRFTYKVEQSLNYARMQLLEMHLSERAP